MLKVAIIVLLCLSGLVTIFFGVIAEKGHRNREGSGDGDAP